MGMDIISQAVLAQHLRRDPPRDVPRARVVVECAGDGVVEIGHLFSKGRNEIEVYEDEIKHLEGLVETASPDDRARVQADFEAHDEESLAASKSGADVSDRSALPSYQYSFRRLMRRDPKPFVSVRRIDEKATKKAA